MTFAEKLQMGRKAQHLTQQELAKRCGLSTRTIQNYELGERKPKSRGTYTKLSEVLHISEKDLIDNNAVLKLRISKDVSEYESGYRAGRQSLQPKWINAEEHPPKQDGIYFAVIEDESGTCSIGLYEMFAAGSWLVDKKRKVRYWAEQSSFDLPEELRWKGA